MLWKADVFAFLLVAFVPSLCADSTEFIKNHAVQSIEGVLKLFPKTTILHRYIEIQYFIASLSDVMYRSDIPFSRIKILRCRVSSEAFFEEHDPTNSESRRVAKQLPAETPQPSVLPDVACTLFGRGYENVVWDSDQNMMRTFPDEQCSEEGIRILQNASVGRETSQKICSLTGPFTRQSSCGENSYLGLLYKFASSLIGRVTNTCRCGWLHIPAKILITDQALA